MLVLFGSQTGTAAEVAEHIVREARRRGMVFRISAMDDYDAAGLIAETFVLFVCSTTGSQAQHQRKNQPAIR